MTYSGSHTNWALLIWLRRADQGAAARRWPAAAGLDAPLLPFLPDGPDPLFPPLLPSHALF